MNWFEKVERYYKKGYYNNEKVGRFVKAKKITKEQYKEITGVDYIV